MKISVIIPTYNESREIANCLESLKKQTSQFQLILVDDGSTDSTVDNITRYKPDFTDFKLLQSNHQGPAAARNLGAAAASGDIFVFVDADMTYEPEFLKKLVAPIVEKKAQGTFTREEYVGNWHKVLARCWNYNLGLPDKKRLPNDYPDSAPVFRAILASEFKKVGGFTPGIGWTDDWTLSRKLGYKSQSTQAVCYHANPSSFGEVFYQANWMGKNEYMTRDLLRIMYSLLRHSIPVGITLGLFKSLIHWEPLFIPFKLVYDLGITAGVWSAVFGGHKNK